MKFLNEKFTRVPEKIAGKIQSFSQSENWPRAAGKRFLLALIFLTPFFFLPATASPADTAKNFLLAALSSAAFLGVIVYCVKKREILFPKSFLAIAAAGLVFLFFISSVFSKSWVLSVYGSLLAADSLFNVIFYIFAFFAAFYFLEKEDLEKTAWAFFGGAAVLSVLTLLQIFGKLNFSFLGNMFTPAGSFFNWGIVLALSFIFLLEIPFKNLSSRNKILSLLFGILTLFSLYVLNFSVLYLVLAFALIMSAALKFAGKKQFVFQMIFATLFLSLFFVGSRLPAVRPIPAEVYPDISSTLSVSGSAILGPRIFFGSGPATFGLDWTLLRPQKINSTPFLHFRFLQGFNWYATLLGTLGLFGFLSFLTLLYAALGRVLQAEDENIHALGAGLLFLSAIWVFHPASVYDFLIFFIGLGLLVKLGGASGAINLSSFSNKKLFAAFLAFMIFAVLIVSAIFIFGQKYLAAAYNAKALRAVAGGDIAQALNYWNSAIALDGGSDEYLRYGSQALLSEINQKIQNGFSNISASDQNQIARTAELSISAAKRATEINSANSDNWNNLGSVYEGLISVAGGAGEAAIQSYEQAISLDPKNPDLKIAEARVFLGLSQRSGASDASSYVAKASGALNAAITLKSDYALPRFMLGQILYQTNQFDAARQMLESALNIDPANLNAHYFLGLAYDKLGMKAEALRQFQLLSAAAPNDPNISRILKNLEEGKGALETANSASPKSSKKK